MEYFKGMKIVCVDDEECKIKLKKGKEYIVESWNDIGVKVEGIDRLWRNTRFELSVNNTTNKEEILLEKISKLTERKVKLESMEKITRRKMIDIGDKRRSVNDELKRTMEEYCDIVTKKMEEMA